MWFGVVCYVTCTLYHYTALYSAFSSLQKKNKPVPLRYRRTNRKLPLPADPTEESPHIKSTSNQWNYVLIHNNLTAGIMQLRSIILALILTVLHQVSSQKKPNNVCPTYRDYFNMLNNSKCWYDFAAEMTVVSTANLTLNHLNFFVAFSSRILSETPAIQSSRTQWERGTISIWRCFEFRGFVRTNHPFLCCTGCRAPRGFL